MRKRLWDAQRHDEYVRQRDAAIQRQIDEREGTAVARDIDARWAALGAEERRLLSYLLRSDIRCFVGECADPLLARLVERGMLTWPPGVRPVLTDDLVTVFMVPPAIWEALDRRRARFLADADDGTPEEGARRYASRITPIAHAQAAPAAKGSAASAIGRATLLLTARIDDASEAPKPLSLSEYHGLARWLEPLGLTFAALLHEDAPTILQAHAEADRVLRLLRRSAAVDALLDHWSRNGLWVLAERESGFPARLRERLKTSCMPLLFGAGPRAALDQGGICIVGSRDSPEEALAFARLVGRRAGTEGLVVVSSDMRGVDRDAVSAALDAGGRVICVLADGLEKAVASRRFRDAIAAGRATLVTPFMPDIRFAVANAMRANRYQYALSDAAIVVETRQFGGIWSGADENRKHRWVPAFVRTAANVSSGNNALLHLGLLPITHQDVEACGSLAQLLLDRASSPPAPESQRPMQDLYAIFLAELQRLDAATAASAESVARYFGIELEQARAWLARARR